jgi:hypothetical protein
VPVSGAAFDAVRALLTFATMTGQGVVEC